MLQKYFETQIGKTIKKNMVTGQTFFTEVYERVFQVEVIGVDSDKLYVEVSSYDKTPSNMMKGGTNRDLGSVEIDYNKYKTKDQVIYAIVEKVDMPFLNKYLR